MNQLILKGYVHNVTKATLSRSGTNYFNFSSQVNETRKRRAVCYDTSKQSLLQGYQDSKQPITLLNITEKPSLLDPAEQHVILGKRSHIEPLNNDQLTFNYDNTQPAENEPRLTTIHDARLLNGNDFITVKGTLTLETDSIREVPTKNGFLMPMLNRCTITDNTATIRLTLWGDLMKQVATKNSYAITHIRIRQYDSDKYLTTTPSTTITPCDEHFPSPTKESFNSIFDAKAISVDSIRIADNFKLWLSSAKCQNLLIEQPFPAATILKCFNWNAAQPASSCPTNASVCIAVRDNKHDLVWLKVFTPLLQKMLVQPSTDVTIDSTEDNIYEQLFKLRNLTIHYSNTSNIVKSVEFQNDDKK